MELKLGADLNEIEWFYISSTIHKIKHTRTLNILLKVQNEITSKCHISYHTERTARKITRLAQQYA